MSLLQTHLGARPQGSCVNHEGARADKALAERQFSVGQEEVRQAKALQKLHPDMTWTQALRAVKTDEHAAR